MAAPRSSRSQVVAAMAARELGVCNADVQARFTLKPEAAGVLLVAAEKHYGLVKAGAPGQKTHWFISQATALAWVLRTDKPKPRPPKPRRPKYAPQPLAAPAPIAAPMAAPVTFPQPPAPRVQPIAAAAPAPSTLWRARPAPAPAAFPAQAVAVGQPTVPGWGGGPPIRAGAFDFKRHQHKGGF